MFDLIKIDINNKKTIIDSINSYAPLKKLILYFLFTDSFNFLFS